jgi:hypothetical protein
MVQFGFVAGDTHGNRLARDEIMFPVQPAGLFMQFRKSRRVKLPQADEYAAGSAQLEVGAVKRLEAALEGHTAAFTGITAPPTFGQLAQAAQFERGETPEPRGSYGEKRVHLQKTLNHDTYPGGRCEGEHKGKTLVFLCALRVLRG